MSGQLPGTLDALLGRQWRALRPSVPVDRGSDRWRRVREALCPHHGLAVSLDEYADAIVASIPKTTHRPGSNHLDGGRAPRAEEVTE